jgi:HEPN domain-containing protein
MGSEYKEWIEKAEQDLDTAKYNLKGNKLEAGIFFLQQSSEKALKALYIKKFKMLFKTHNLVVLARALKANNKILEVCEKLNPAYQFTRYPDVVKVNSLEKRADEFLEYAEEILKWVKKSL